MVLFLGVFHSQFLNMVYNPFYKFHVSICRNGEADENNNVSLDAIFNDDEYDMLEDDSDSDGYLSEVLSSFADIIYDYLIGFILTLFVN